MAYSILEITDGTYANTVTLIAEGYGIHLKEWNPSLPPFKQGGVFQSSSLAGGSIPVIAEFDDAVEAFSLAVNGPGMDATIRQTQDLIRLLQEAIYYWTTGKGKPIYIRAKSPCETGTRYAHLKFYGIPNVDNPYASPFFIGRKLATMDDFELTVTRGHWLANAPGTGECLTISSVQEWLYQDWETNHTEADNFYSILELANGNLLAGTSSEVSRSTDNGGSWSATALAAAGAVYDMIQLTSGRVLAACNNGSVFRSDDNGATFGSSAASGINPLYCIAQSTDTGTVVVGALGQLSRSTDNGESWTVVSGVTTATNFTGMAYFDGSFYAAEAANVWRSDDDGLTWSLSLSSSLSLGVRLQVLDDVDILMAAFSNTSADNIISFYILQGFGNHKAWSLLSTYDPSDASLDYLAGKFAYSGGEIYYTVYLSVRGAGDTQIIYSKDWGKTWEVERISATLNVFGLLITSTGDVYAGETTNLLKKSATTADMGASNSCDGEVYIANKMALANLTHIKISDGGVFTDLFPISSFPQDLLPAVPAADDAVYFGSNTSLLDAGPFSSLVFDLVPITLTGSYTIVWEYWSGAAWSTLTITDNTQSGGDSLSLDGVLSIYWVPPSDWATTAVDSITGYWVRARVSALTGSITPPAQQNRQIYSITQPYLEVADTEVLGDIPALARYQLFNRSDRDGRGGNTPDLWDNRIIAGLRSFSGTSYFQAYLNISDEQGPLGITVSLGADTSFAADTTAPTGRRAVYNPAGVEAMATRATITLSPVIARDFYGTFHAYARAQRTAGSSTDLTLRLQVVTGSGGITFTSESVQLQTTTAFELLDFGQIELPVSGGIKDTELPDTTQIIIQASAASGTPDLYLYDLILIPVDEWAIDAVDFANSADSVIGQVDAAIYRLLDVDSIAFPLLDIRSLVRQDDSDQLIVAAYDPITSGEAIAQNNTDQRLWVLCAQTAATGTDPDWIAPPAIAHSIKAYKNERWLALRGDE